MTRNGFSRSSHKWLNLLPEKFAFLVVTRVYLLRLQTMSTNDQNSRGAAVTSADQIGKVFIVVGQDVRKCLPSCL